MDYLWRYSQVWEAGERACQLLVWIRFYLIVTVAAFTVLQTLVRYRVMKASAEIFKCGPPQPEEPAKLSVGTTASTSFSLQRDSGKVLDSSVEITSVHVRENGVNVRKLESHNSSAFVNFESLSESNQKQVGKLNSFVQIAKAMGHAITFIACWPKRYVFLNKPNITCEEGNNSNFDRRLRKRSFNENRLIILGWVLPLLLCAPEVNL